MSGLRLQPPLPASLYQHPVAYDKSIQINGPIQGPVTLGKSSYFLLSKGLVALTFLSAFSNVRS